mmetsp:Transcript_3319/g.7314  ORF Transcript_3319/g.7314 Transcript_3319/m.7314 type:complete len:232 (+) Transcript_3319:491-1186(+)
MDHYLLASPISATRHDLPYSKHVLSPRLPKSRCHHLQRTQSDENPLGGTLLLFAIREKAIVHADVGIDFITGGGVGHGGGVAFGLQVLFGFLFGDGVNNKNDDGNNIRRWRNRRCNNSNNKIDIIIITIIILRPNLPTRIPRSPPHSHSLPPLRPRRSHHPKKPPKSKSSRPPLYHGIVHCLLAAPPSIVCISKSRWNEDSTTRFLRRMDGIYFDSDIDQFGRRNIGWFGD